MLTRPRVKKQILKALTVSKQKGSSSSSNDVKLDFALFLSTLLKLFQRLSVLP